MANSIYRKTSPIVLCLTLSLVTIGLSACASLPDGRDITAVNALLKDRSAKVAHAVDRPTPSVLTLDKAVEMAVVNSPKLGLIYGQLGLDQADILQAIEVANPRLGLSNLTSGSALGGIQTQSLSAPLTDLILLPARMKLANRAKERARLQLANALISVQLDVETAWYEAVAAEQVAQMRMAVADSLKTSADLAERYFNAGNLSELDLSREQAAASEAMITAQQASIAATVARAKLNSQMGLGPTGGDWPLSTALPLPAEHEDRIEDLQVLASTHNLALMAADQDILIWDQVTSTRQATQLLGDTAIGLEREKDREGIRTQGPRLDLELPIFNQGQAKTAQVTARRDLARAHRADLRVTLQNQIVARFNELQHRRVILDLYGRDLIGQRQTIVARSQEQQTYMLIGVFSLIKAKTQAYDAYQGYIQAVRDYWLARVELTRLVGTRLPSTPDEPKTGPSAADMLAPLNATPMPMPDHNHAGQP
jgi:outer membrane protein, heavy metal efflux system